MHDQSTERCISCDRRHPGRCEFSPVYDDPSFDDLLAGGEPLPRGCADCGIPVDEDETRCRPHAEEMLRGLGFVREQADLGVDVARRLLGVA